MALATNAWAPLVLLPVQCLSWVFSPILAGSFAIILFFTIRFFILRHQSAYQRSLYLLPIFTFGTFFLVSAPAQHSGSAVPPSWALLPAPS